MRISFFKNLETSMVEYTCNPSTPKLKEKAGKSKTTLDYTARPCFKQTIKLIITTTTKCNLETFLGNKLKVKKLCN
jgi:hypothetical protein